MADWGSEAVADKRCSSLGHEIVIFAIGSDKGVSQMCSKCGLTLEEIRAGKKEN